MSHNCHDCGNDCGYQQGKIAELEARIEASRCMCGSLFDEPHNPFCSVVNTSGMAKQVRGLWEDNKITELEGEIEEWKEEERRYGLIVDDLKARAEAAEASLKESEERADRLYQDRYDLLNVTSTDGLLSCEWLMRTATAERKAKAAEALLDDCKAGYRTALATTEAAEAKAVRYVLALNGRYWVLIDGEYSCAFCGSLRTDGHTSGCVKAQLDSEKGE